MCPQLPGGVGPTVAPPWAGPTIGSPDIFNICGVGPVGVPFNFPGLQSPLTGEGYAGVYARSAGEYREYLQTWLTETLTAGTQYYVGFYVSRAEFGCAIEHMGAYISAENPNSNNVFYLDYTPQIESSGTLLNDSEGWTLISGCFTAGGGELFITIGNFHPDSETPLEENCLNNLSYYYIEDVFLIELGEEAEIPIDLGGPQVGCGAYTIDPGYPEYQHLWEDGSTDLTLTVTESGFYSLTVSDGCNMGTDSIEVIFPENDPVDLGPDQVVLCEGDVYTITLDSTFIGYEWNDGSTQSTYSIMTPGTYSVTMDNGCYTSSDEINVVLLQTPAAFDLGEDGFLCPGDEIELILDPDAGDFLWQDQSTQSTYTVDIEGIYSLTISNACGSVNDEIVITSLDIPIVDLGTDSTLLCNGDFLEFMIEPGPGDITWQDGSNDSHYYISTPGIYSVSVSNMCGSSFDEIEVFVAEAPVVNLGTDLQWCDTIQLVLTANNVDGNYLWHDLSTNDSLLITTSGTYSLTVDNICGMDTDTINVNFSAPLASIDFGPDLDLCPGDQLILYTNQQAANTLWQDGSTADSLIVTSSGSYFAIASNICGLVTDTIAVTTEGIPPALNLPSQIYLCKDDTIALDAGLSGVNYLWNDQSTNNQLHVSSPGIYTLMVSNACGNDTDTIIVIDSGPDPQVDLGNDVQLCVGDIFIISPTFSNVDTWLWQDGSTLPTYTITNIDTVNVEVSNTCGTAYDTLQVTWLPPAPPFELGNDTSICNGETLILSIDASGVTIIWHDGSTDTEFAVENAGSVFAAVSNSCGTSYDTIQVYPSPTIPSLNLGNDQTLCPGEIIILAPGILDVQYVWHDGSTGNTYSTTQQETIILTITNECGVNTDTLVVTESNLGPILNLGPDIQACEGEVVTILSGISGVNYVWQDGSTQSAYTTTQSGTFVLEVMNNCGSATDTIAIDISGVPPTPLLGPDTILCEGLPFILASDADAETSIEWQDGSTNQMYSVITTGTYILFETNRCGEATDTISVSIVEGPDPFSLGPDTILCAGETMVLIAPSITHEILWQDGSSDPQIIVDQAITYILQLSNDCGTVHDTININYDTLIPHFSIDPFIYWCEEDIIMLDATQPHPAQYLWNTGAVTPAIAASTPGVYQVDVTTTCMTASHEIEIIEGKDCKTEADHIEIFIPNIFSPNNDGINDIFYVSVGSNIELVSMEGNIFDRWGSLVFGGKEKPFKWDGFSKDAIMLPGVYAFLIKVTYIDEHQKEQVRTYAGDLTLVR